MLLCSCEYCQILASPTRCPAPSTVEAYARGVTTRHGPHMPGHDNRSPLFRWRRHSAGQQAGAPAAPPEGSCPARTTKGVEPLCLRAGSDLWTVLLALQTGRPHSTAPPHRQPATCAPTTHSHGFLSITVSIERASDPLAFSWQRASGGRRRNVGETSSAYGHLWYTMIKLSPPFSTQGAGDWAHPHVPCVGDFSGTPLLREGRSHAIMRST